MKKVMIAVLAIAMLFGFAACSNETDSNVSAGLAEKIYSDDTPVIVEGEKVDLSMWSLKALDTFGNPTSINASDVIIAADDETPVNADGTKAETVKVSVSTSWGAAGELSVKVLPVTEIEVDAEDAATTEYFAVIGTPANVDKAYKNGLIDKTGVKITATYIDQDGKEQEKVVDNALVDFSIADEDWVKGPDKTVNVTYANVPGTYTVDMIDNKVASLSIEVAADYQPIASASTALDTDKFVVYGTYQNGQKVALTADTQVKYSMQTEYGASAKTYGNADAITFTEAGAKTVYVKLDNTVSMIEGGNRYANASVTAVADSLKEIVIEVSSAATLTVDADYDWTDTGAGYPDEIVVYTMTNGGVKSSALTAKTDYTLSPLDAEAAATQVGHEIETGDTLTITVTPTANGAAKGLAAKSITVTVGTAFSNVTAG